MEQILGPIEVKVGQVCNYTLSPPCLPCIWVVDGGQIISGQNSCDIQVQWTRSGPGQVQANIQNPQGGTDIIIIDTNAG
jgi:hypothetical protein